MLGSLTILAYLTVGMSKAETQPLSQVLNKEVVRVGARNNFI